MPPETVTPAVDLIGQFNNNNADFMGEVRRLHAVIDQLIGSEKDVGPISPDPMPSDSFFHAAVRNVEEFNATIGYLRYQIGRLERHFGSVSVGARLVGKAEDPYPMPTDRLAHDQRARSGGSF